jgi:hypothetical protein
MGLRLQMLVGLEWVNFWFVIAVTDFLDLRTLKEKIHCPGGLIVPE